MAVPISEAIAVELRNRLELLTVPGYETLVCEVVRPLRMGGFTPKDLQIVLTQGPQERNDELDCPGNPPANAYEITFNIRCHVSCDERSDVPVDTTINIFAADVVAAVCSVDQWHTFLGNSINAQWQTHENIISEGSFDGVNIPLKVTFRTDEGNPYNVRA